MFLRLDFERAAGAEVFPMLIHLDEISVIESREDGKAAIFTKSGGLDTAILSKNSFTEIVCKLNNYHKVVL